MALRRNQFYRVKDRVPADRQKALGLLDYSAPMVSLDMAARNVSAVWTGEKRCPRKGEWYLSGAIIEAYCAPNDLSTAFHIARLVRTETVTVTREGRAS